MAAPIELNFYDENEEIIETFRISVIRFGMLKKAVKLQAQIDAEGEDATSDALAHFVIEIFGGKFGVTDLEDKADLTQVMAVFRAVITRAQLLAGPENFLPGQA